MEENKRRWIIYMYTFPNGKRYIGKSSRSLNQRQGTDWKRYRNCTALWNAIQKYGVENIHQKILFDDYMTDEYASRLEQICTLLFKTNCNKFDNPKYGYNLTDGGEGLLGWHPDAERLKILREQMRIFHEQAKGKPVSEETRRKQSEAKKGKPGHPMTDEQRRKLSLANSKETMSDETRMRRERAIKERQKQVIATHKFTKEQLVFESVTSAAEYFNTRIQNVTRWCNKTRRSSIDYDFDYLSTNND